MFQLRDYQIGIAKKALSMLEDYKIACLSLEVRVGKTFTALHAAELYGSKKVLFLTKKKAIPGIQSDYDTLAPAFKLLLTNYEQLPNFQEEGFDLIIADECHCLSAFPKPAVRTGLLKNIAAGLPIIFLSGTFTPESFSQIYHILYISTYSPFAEYKSFYKWAEVFVDKKIKYVFNRQLNDYSHAKKEMVMKAIDHLFISYTQEEAGFIQSVKEEVLKVDMKDTTYKLARLLIKDRIYICKDGREILADTEVKLQNKLHQIFSGTVICEDGTPLIIDNYKAEYIKQRFKSQKIAIFYKFKAELALLIATFGAENITESPELFNSSSDKTFVSQIQSGREGINLSTADALIMYNIDFSSVSYQQAKARIQAKDRVSECLLYWIMAEHGMEEKIYERVINKQDYTNYWFKKDFGIKQVKKIA